MNELINDMRIMGTTTVLALNFYTELCDREFAPESYHRYFSWLNPERCTHDMVADTAQILFTYEQPIQAYYKYTN